MKHTFSILILSVVSLNTFAQSDLGKGISYSVEAEGTISSGDNAPLWLSSNKQGLGSVESNSGFERISITRDIETDSLRNWKRGYGVDVVLNQNSTSDFLIHQAYFETAYKKISLTVGAKERQIDMRNNNLTSGGLSLGINAIPIPQVLVDVDYFSIPGTNHWWKWKGRMGYGMTTDGNWQESWSYEKAKYNDNSLYHEKALYWKVGREEVFPLTFEIGIQMFAQFGGKSYNVTGRNYHDSSIPLKHASNLNAFWHAFWPMGSDGDVTDGTVKNIEGNQLGSYQFVFTWTDKNWKARAYFERFFEDHSMLTVQYGFYDHLLGIDVQLPKNKFVSNVLVEHLSTKDQSGPVYHDKTHNIPDAIAGMDDYYNHGQYSGWQHWGMGLGNPLITSPIYNSNHYINFANNRVQAWHFGLDGQPTDEIDWRMLFSFTRNWGTYYYPNAEVLNQNYFLMEIGYAPKALKGWSGRVAIAIDHGKQIGNSTGTQLTICKRGWLTK